jgi:hypothetical protein
MACGSLKFGGFANRFENNQAVDFVGRQFKIEIGRAALCAKTI